MLAGLIIALLGSGLTGRNWQGDPTDDSGLRISL